MIDWSDEPDFVKPQNVVELRTMADAMKLLDEWQQAYDEAVTAWARLHNDYCKALWRAEAAETLAYGFESLYIAALDPANDEIRDTLRRDLLQIESLRQE